MAQYTNGSTPNTTTASGGTQASDVQQASGFLGRVRERATSQIETQKERALDGLGSVAQAVRGSTQQLRDQRHDTVAQYVEQAADQIERLSRRLREKEIGEFFADVQRFAERQPAVFIGSAFALGFFGARFLKSSTSNNALDEYRGYRNDYGRGAESYQNPRSNYATRYSPSSPISESTLPTSAYGSPSGDDFSTTETRSSTTTDATAEEARSRANESAPSGRKRGSRKEASDV